MGEKDALDGTVLEDAALTVDEVAYACSASTEWVVQHVEEGILCCSTGGSSEWRFSSRDLSRARRVRAMERDFDAVPELAALVADMLEEMDALRSRLRRAGLD